MGKDLKDDIQQNYKDFLAAGEDELKKERYNPAISSFFKAMAILCDLKIYTDRRVLPKNHTERFQILKNNLVDFDNQPIHLSAIFFQIRSSGFRNAAISRKEKH